MSPIPVADNEPVRRLLEVIDDADYVPDDVRRAARAVRQAASGASGVIEVPVGTPLANVERLLIDETLRRTGGNRQRAAAMLGIAARTIYRKLASTPGEGDDAGGPPA